jgi:hypothetical protein
MIKKVKKPNGDANGAIMDMFNRSFQIQMQNWKELMELQLHSAGLVQECANGCMQRLGDARTITDLMAVESGLVAEYSTKFLEDARRYLDALSRAQLQMMECINECNDQYDFAVPASGKSEGAEHAAKRIEVT